MADTKLRLEVIMAAVDRLTRPLKSIMDGSKTTSVQVKALRDRLKDLNGQTGQIENFRRLQAQTAIVGNNMAAAQEKVKTLATALQNTEAPTKVMERAFAAAKREAAALNTQHTEMTQRVQRQRDALNAAGLATTALASHQSRLKTEVQGTTSALDAEQKKLEQINAQAKRLQAARANYDKTTATQAKLAGTGAVATTTGGAIMFGLNHAIDGAGHYQKDMLRIKALGMGDHVVADSDKFARGMHKYGTSMRDNIDMMRDGLTIFADLHHAEMAVPVMQKMKFANQAMFGEKGGEKTNQLYEMLKVVELRGGAKDAKTFEAEANLIQKVMSSTGGRVGSKDYRELIQTGGVAAKQLNTDTFYNILEPMIQEMGGHQVGTGLMSAFQNMYLGKSTTSAVRTMSDLGLLKPDMVEYDKIGQVKRMKTGGLVGSESYKTNPFEWLETHFLPALKAKGITDPSAVRDMLATVMGSRTGAKVFSTYLDQKDQIQKSAGRNRNAAGINQTYDISLESVDGKKLALAKRFEDVQQLLGEKLLPLYANMIDAVHTMTNGIANFTQAHPSLVTWLGYTAATLGTVLVVFGALALAVAAVLGPFALARLAMVTLGISTGGTTVMLTKLRLAMLASAAPSGLIGRSMGAMGSATSTARVQLVAYTRSLYANTTAQLAANRAGAAARWQAAGQYIQSHGGVIGTAGHMGKTAVLGTVGGIKSGAVGTVKALGGAFTFLSQRVVFAGRALLLNPIGLAVTAIAATAYLVYKYWGPIKAFFSGMWDGFKEGLAPLAPMFNTVFGVLSAALAPLKPVWDWIVGAMATAWNWVSKLFAPFQATTEQISGATEAGRGFGAWLAGLIVTVAGLAGKFMGFGRDIVMGLVSGITGAMGAAKETILNLGANVATWFKDKLGIRSPSRLFTEFGGYTVAGLEKGITDNQKGPLNAVRAMAAKLAAVGAGITIGTGAMANPTPIDTRPLSATRATGTQAQPASAVHITISLLGLQFAALWQSIKDGASAAWQWVSQTASTVAQGLLNLFLNWTLPGLIIKHWDSIVTFMLGLPTKFSTIGGQIIDGLMGGLQQRWDATKAWFADMGHKIAQLTRDALGVKSPSRVFADIGTHIMGGLQIGLEGGEDGPLARMRTMAAKLAALGAGITIGAGAMANPTPIDTRPPLGAARAAGTQAQPAGAANITIHIHAAPGMDTQALARLVGQEVEKATRQAQAARRSRLSDPD